MTIVVLEDSPVAALMVRLHLELYGYHPVIATKLGELVDVLRPPMPRAFIIDRNLPDGDGLAAVKALRGAGYDGPVLVVSASKASDAEATAAALAAGADGYLSKPMTAAALMDELLAAERRRGRAPG